MDQQPTATTRRRRQPTLAAVRRKCLECVNRDRIGFDCKIPDCALHECMAAVEGPA